MKFSPYRGSIDSLLQAFLPDTFPSILFILILLLSYIVVLGPVRFLLVRRLKRRDWSWRITLIAILVFSLLSYGLALYPADAADIEAAWRLADARMYARKVAGREMRMLEG